MALRSTHTGLQGKLYEINWLLLALIFLVGCVGVAMIYSATGGQWNFGAKQHFSRLVLGMVFMLIIALIDIRVWFSLAYPAYIGAIILLLGVEFFGVSVNGSQRWLDLGITRVQPSELMKMALVLALARFYHDLPYWRVSKPVGIGGAVLIIFLPVGLVLRQPDLGTALLLAATGVTIIFLAGINWRIIITSVIATIISVPLALKYALKDYQKARVLTFLDPERDPTGASYHIIQSKIALGSGGVSGKGFMEGTQASLKYVPENRTDFIFTVIGEEFGLMGGAWYNVALCSHHWTVFLAGKSVPSRVLPFTDIRIDDHIRTLCIYQYGDGYGACACGWCAAPADFLWRDGYAGRSGRFRFDVLGPFAQRYRTSAWIGTIIIIASLFAVCHA